MACLETGCGRKAVWRGFCQTHGMRRYRSGEFRAGTRPRGTPEERFWAKVKCGEPNECWFWVGSKRPNGYGHIQVNGRGGPFLSAHRFSYELHKGRIPRGLIVMHSCDNPSCVNPAHLNVGTHADNTADMISKGRHVVGSLSGEENPRSKLTEDKVRFIRAHPGMGHKEIADMWGLSPNAVRGVRIGRTWTHID